MAVSPNPLPCKCWENPPRNYQRLWKAGGYLYGFWWAEPKYKKGCDLLFQSPGGEKKRKCLGITERDFKSINEATSLAARSGLPVFMHRVVQWGQVSLTLRVTGSNHVWQTTAPLGIKYVWYILSFWPSGVLSQVSLLGSMPLPLPVIQRGLTPSNRESGQVLQLIFPTAGSPNTWASETVSWNTKYIDTTIN